MLVQCPSGLTFNARRWRIGDRRNLHDQRVVRQGLLMRKMLECIDEGVEDPGPYQTEVGKPMNWAKAALTDIIDALIVVRISTKPMLDYNEMCENCGAKIPLQIDLRELGREPMSVEGKQHLGSGEPMVVSVPLIDPEGPEAAELPADDAGNLIVPTVMAKLRMLTGEDMPKLTRHYKQSPETMQEAQMVMHIVELVTGDSKTIKHQKKVQDFYALQDWYFQEGLEDHIVKMGGGIDTKVDMACMRCNAEQQGILPFGAEFFYPQKSRNISSMGML